MSPLEGRLEGWLVVAEDDSLSVLDEALDLNAPLARQKVMEMLRLL